MKAVIQVVLLTSVLLLADIARSQDIVLEPDRVWNVPASVESLREEIDEDATWNRGQIAATEAFLSARAAGAADPEKAWVEVVRRSRDYEDWEAEVALEAGIGEAPCPFSAGGRCVLSNGEFYPVTPASPTLREAVFNESAASGGALPRVQSRRRDSRGGGTGLSGDHVPARLSLTGKEAGRSYRLLTPSPPPRDRRPGAVRRGPAQTPVRRPAWRERSQRRTRCPFTRGSPRAVRRGRLVQIPQCVA